MEDSNVPDNLNLTSAPVKILRNIHMEDFEQRNINQNCSTCIIDFNLPIKIEKSHPSYPEFSLLHTRLEPITLQSYLIESSLTIVPASLSIIVGTVNSTLQKVCGNFVFYNNG